MNASMARRIRFAESGLIYATDRQYGGQRERRQAASKPRDPLGWNELPRVQFPESAVVAFTATNKGGEVLCL